MAATVMIQSLLVVVLMAVCQAQLSCYNPRDYYSNQYNMNVTSCQIPGTAGYMPVYVYTYIPSGQGSSNDGLYDVVLTPEPWLPSQSTLSLVYAVNTSASPMQLASVSFLDSLVYSGYAPPSSFSVTLAGEKDATFLACTSACSLKSSAVLTPASANYSLAASQPAGSLQYPILFDQDQGFVAQISYPFDAPSYSRLHLPWGSRIEFAIITDGSLNPGTLNIGAVIPSKNNSRTAVVLSYSISYSPISLELLASAVVATSDGSIDMTAFYDWSPRLMYVGIRTQTETTSLSLMRLAVATDGTVSVEQQIALPIAASTSGTETIDGDITYINVAAVYPKRSLFVVSNAYTGDGRTAVTALYSLDPETLTIFDTQAWAPIGGMGGVFGGAVRVASNELILSGSAIYSNSYLIKVQPFPVQQ